MRLGWTAAVTLLLATVPVWGQEEALPDLFSDVIDVRVVNVEVVVTDKKGNRIRGLEASDFELLVDGEAVPVDYFTEVDNGHARGSADDGAGTVHALATGEPVATNYLVFIDDLHAIRQSRNRVLKRLGQDLDRLRPADRMAVVAYDGRNLTRITDWTSSRDEIEDALLRASDRTALGLLNKFGLGFQTQRSVMAAAGTLRSFADAPGRKVMLLLAAGWDTEIDLWNPRLLWLLGLRDARLGDLYGPLVHAANLVGYSLYPIDLGKGRPWRHNGLTGLAAPFAGQPVAAEDSRSWHDVLRYLADETGGLPMIKFFSNKALAKTSEDTRSYYWLGFAPPRAEDDALHDIKVRLIGRPKLRVRSRRNYMDMSRRTEVTMLVEGSLLFGGAPGANALEVRFGTPEKAGFRKIAVPMEVAIPLDDLTVLPTDGQWMNELEFRVTVIDEFGDRSETPISKIPILSSRTPLPGETFVYETDLLMRKREHRFVAAVYDPLSGAILSAEGTVGPE